MKHLLVTLYYDSEPTEVQLLLEYVAEETINKEGVAQIIYKAVKEYSITEREGLHPERFRVSEVATQNITELLIKELTRIAEADPDVVPMRTH